MRKRRVAGRVSAQTILILACLIAVFPLLWIALTSFKNEVDASAPATRAFEFSPTLSNYSSVFRSSTFVADAVTTIVTTAGTTFLCVLVGTLAAHAFARLRVTGRALIVTMMVLVQVVPSIVLLIPLYKIASALGLYDQWITIIVIQAGLLTPFVTWLMVAFFRALPFEVEEAARVDGANRLQMFRYVLIAMLTPGMVAGRDLHRHQRVELVSRAGHLGPVPGPDANRLHLDVHHHRPAGLVTDVRFGRAHRRADRGLHPDPAASAGQGHHGGHAEGLELGWNQ